MTPITFLQIFYHQIVTRLAYAIENHTLPHTIKIIKVSKEEKKKVATKITRQDEKLQKKSNFTNTTLR